MTTGMRSLFQMKTNLFASRCLGAASRPLFFVVILILNVQTVVQVWFIVLYVFTNIFTSLV